MPTERQRGGADQEAAAIDQALATLVGMELVKKFTGNDGAARFRLTRLGGEIFLKAT
jgi:hypothetical protein